MKLVRFHIWSIVLHGSETWTLKINQSYLEILKMRCWRRTEKIKSSRKVTNKEAPENVGEKTTILNNILRRRVNRIGHILNRNCLHHSLEGRWLNEMSWKKKNAVPWRFEKQETMGAKGGSWRSRKVEKTVYQSNIRKKYKLSSISSRTC